MLWMIVGVLALIAAQYLDYKDKSFDDHPILDVQFDIIAKFMVFLSLLACFRLALYDLTGPMDLETLTKHSLAGFSLVWLEDAGFVLPFFLAFRLLKSIKLKLFVVFPLFLASVVYFCTGHLYQGTFIACVVAIYPFLSMRYGARYGFGTVMACHVLYDFSTYLTGWLYWMYHSSLRGII